MRQIIGRAAARRAAGRELGIADCGFGMSGWRDSSDMGQDLADADGAAVNSCGHERGERFGKVEWVDLVECQLAILKFEKEFCVFPPPGGKRLDGARLATAVAQMRQEQRGEQGLADAGVSAGNED